MKIKLVWIRGAPGAHDRCRVYVGADPYHFALAGVLTFRRPEAEAFRLVVRSGIDPRTGITGIFESGWTENG